LRDSYNEKKNYYYVTTYEDATSEVFEDMQLYMPGLVIELTIPTNFAKKLMVILERDFNRNRVGFANNTRRKSSWYNISLEALKDAIYPELQVLVFEDMLRLMSKQINKLDDEETEEVDSINAIKELLVSCLQKLTRKEYICLFLCIPDSILKHFERNDYMLDTEEQQQIIEMMHWSEYTEHIDVDVVLQQRFYCC